MEEIIQHPDTGQVVGDMDKMLSTCMMKDNINLNKRCWGIKGKAHFMRMCGLVRRRNVLEGDGEVDGLRDRMGRRLIRHPSQGCEGR